ncbi:MAG TPA: DUF6152 family protein [Gammaproteobacteria bacterium]|nr:DUF6152 family protein [Gammaproteobacteria bacterium]
MRAFALGALLLIAGAAAAHHSRSHYSRETREIEGELVAVHWVNPHVGVTLKVRGAAGDEELWRVEGVPSLVTMQRVGLAGDRLTIGERITAVGSVSLRRDRDFLATNFLLEDGTELVLDADAGPYGSGPYIGNLGPAPAARVDTAAENRGIFRVWSPPADGAGQREDFPYTAAAIAARAAWDPVDNFAERCEPEGMPRIMRNPHPFQFVDRGTEIAIVSELYDLVRVVHMDRDAPPPDAPATPLGYSVGRWHGRTLAVTTTQVSWPYFDNIGTPQSADVRMEEAFTLSEDQARLDYRLVIADAATFERPAVYERHWLALGAAIAPYNCQVY